MSQEVEKLKELIRLDSDLQSTQDLDILLEKILYEARKFVNADAGTIYLKRGNTLVFSYTQNDTKQKLLPPGQKIIYSIFTVEINRKSISGYVAETKEILNIPDVYKISRNAPYSFNKSYDKLGGYKTTSMLTIPLATNLGEVLGVIQLINAMDANGNVIPFNTDDEFYISHYATAASMALQRAQLTRQLLLRMISMAELRDPKETGPHVNRVAAYAVEIYERWAQLRGMPARDLHKNRDILRMAAMLHDVGKVAISDLILKKPGNFTDDEYEIMKSHTYNGARLFQSKQSIFDEIASEVALTHHENWDGTGYPGRLDIQTGEPLKTLKKGNDGKSLSIKGEDIPIFGRLVSIADVYDALSHRRVYKKAWDEQEVLDEMRKMAGTKFDPELVDIFFEAIPHLRNISKKYPDSE
ncbi:MAG TPA: HD domain-containing phosphohydrolase [Spirochaetia bacterium]|nr:HD domain-containing phosphohydrolase [Spirochaetia bacterium]